MSDVNLSLHVLEEALIHKKWVVGTKEGRCYFAGKLRNFFYKWTKKEVSRVERIASLSIEYLNQLERKPIKFSFDGHQVVQTEDYDRWLKVLSLLEKSLFPHRTLSSMRLAQEIEWRTLGLKYRLEKVNGGLDPSLKADPNSLPSLIRKAEEWKSATSYLEIEELTQEERGRLEEAALYPEQVKALLRSPPLFRKFMRWTIRDGNSAHPFFLFRGIQLKMKECRLEREVGLSIGSGLQLIKRNHSSGYLEKILTLPFLLQQPKEGGEIFTHVSLLDENAILNFPGNYKVTLKSIFEAFRKKETDVGNFRCLSGAVRNWHISHWGHYDAEKKSYVRVNVEKQDFYKELPPIRSFTMDQMQEKTGLEADGKRWIIELDASRQNFDLDVNLVHAGVNFYIPNTKGGYDFHSFGKFPFNCPATALQLYLFLGKVTHGTIRSPDTNPTHKKRQHTFYRTIVDPTVGEFGLNLIQKDKLEETKGNLPFQFISKGCAKWAQDLMNEILKKAGQKEIRFFNTPMLKLTPRGGIIHIIRFVKSLPLKLQGSMTGFILLSLLPWRGSWILVNGKREWFSLFKSFIWKKGNNLYQIYNPARLHRKQLKGKFLPKGRLPAFLKRAKVSPF